MIGACIGQGTKDYTSTFAWRFPIAFNIAITLIIFVGTLFVPESPRWLMTKGRDEKALKSLRSIHKHGDEHEVDTELHVLIEARKAEENNEGNGSKWTDLVLKKADRRRFICAFGILCCQQVSGGGGDADMTDFRCPVHLYVGAYQGSLTSSLLCDRILQVDWY